MKKRAWLLILCASLLSTSFKNKELSNDLPELIYIYDPLCGWCFGFSSTIQQIKLEYEGRVNFRINCGGLATGEMAFPIGEAADYILKALEKVEKKTVASFGQEFKNLLYEDNYVYNSEIPAKALCAIKDIKPALAFDYALDLHNLFFIKGISLNEEQTYINLAEKYSIDKEVFFNKFNSQAYTEKAHAEFASVRAIGISGFPTLLLILIKDGKTHVISSGWTSPKKLKRTIDKLLD